MVDPDRPPPPPTLNPKAKQYERQLHKIFSVDTASIWLTAEDWKGAKAQLEDLAKDVRRVGTELTSPSDGTKGWSGPAAEAALASLQKLGDTLDGHAVKVGDVDSSLNGVYQAVWDAKNAWDAKVGSISTYVDPADHTRLPAPYAPTPENVANYSIPDEEAVAAAEDALWEKRNQAAKQILDDLGVQTQEATGKMPIDSKDSGEGPYSPPGGPAPSGSYPTSTTTPSTSGVYGVHPQQPPTPTHVPPVDGGVDPPPVIHIEPVDPETVVVEEVDPGLTPGPTDPITSDGDTEGSIGLPGPGTSAAASHAGGGGGGGGLGPGGIAAGGVGAGAAGIGGLLGARGRGGGGVVPGAGGQSRGSGAGARGASARPGGAGRTGQVAPGGTGRAGQVVPGAGGSRTTGGSSRAGSSVKGASASGRYGVPKLDGKGAGMVPASTQGGRAGGRAATGGGRAATAAGRGAPGGPGAATARGGAAGRGAAAVGAAGTRGSRKGDKDESQDVDKLTHEDAETWYDGTEESSPQVWE